MQLLKCLIHFQMTFWSKLDLWALWRLDCFLWMQPPSWTRRDFCWGPLACPFAGCKTLAIKNTCEFGVWKSARSIRCAFWCLEDRYLGIQSSDSARGGNTAWTAPWWVRTWGQRIRLGPVLIERRWLTRWVPQSFQMMKWRWSGGGWFRRHLCNFKGCESLYISSKNKTCKWVPLYHWQLAKCSGHSCCSAALHFFGSA